MTGDGESETSRRRGEGKEERERERMNESDGEERGATEPPLYVHWAGKQVAEYIMRMNEEEGTLSPCLSVPTSRMYTSVLRVKAKCQLLIWRLT